MNPNSVSFPNQLSQIYSATLAQTYDFVPRLIGALIILLVGGLIAKFFKKATQKILEFLKVSLLFKNTPVEAFLKHADMGSKIEQVLGSLVYWMVMLLVFQTAISVLGLAALVGVLDRVVAYIPRIFSAVVVLFIGLLVAGVLESLVKGSIKSIDGKHARALGKVASYLTLIIFVMVAISELGIAQQFILILFIGLIATVTISVGLAVGLGSKNTVGKILDEWYERLKQDLKNS